MLCKFIRDIGWFLLFEFYYIILKEVKFVMISIVVNVNMVYRNKFIFLINICIWGCLCYSLNKFKWLLDFFNYKMFWYILLLFNSFKI